DALAAARCGAQLLPRARAGRRGKDDAGARRAPTRRRPQRAGPERLRVPRPPPRPRHGDAEGRRPLERPALRLLALAAVSLALAGCGSSSTASAAGHATLWVTRDRGAH